VATIFFLGRPGLALTDADGVGAFGTNSTIASIVASYRFFLRVVGALVRAHCRSACGKHHESWGSMAGARGESKSSYCPRISASFQ